MQSVTTQARGSYSYSYKLVMATTSRYRSRYGTVCTRNFYILISAKSPGLVNPQNVRHMIQITAT
eukprot:scaffold18200_cov20-Prasinocladus_malaysianus.AAC.1